jgi:uncharacterized protein YjlB
VAGLRERLAAEGLTAAEWSNAAGDGYAAHEHGYDKVIVVERGSITFGMPGSGGAIAVAQGDRLDLPARTAHNAMVGPGGVTCLEAHLPAGSLPELRRRGADEW